MNTEDSEGLTKLQFINAAMLVHKRAQLTIESNLKLEEVKQQVQLKLEDNQVAKIQGAQTFSKNNNIDHLECTMVSSSR